MERITLDPALGYEEVTARAGETTTLLLRFDDHTIEGERVAYSLRSRVSGTVVAFGEAVASAEGAFDVELGTLETIAPGRFGLRVAVGQHAATIPVLITGQAPGDGSSLLASALQQTAEAVELAQGAAASAGVQAGAASSSASKARSSEQSAVDSAREAEEQADRAQRIADALPAGGGFSARGDEFGNVIISDTSGTASVQEDEFGNIIISS